MVFKFKEQLWVVGFDYLTIRFKLDFIVDLDFSIMVNQIMSEMYQNSFRNDLTTLIHLKLFV